MRIKIQTPIKGNYREVISRFDRKLFEALTPPGSQVKLVQFDGSHTGDRVHIKLKLLGFITQDWISEITSHGVDDTHAYFIDEGKQLPFFLSKWRHRHLVHKQGENSMIEDDIYYRSPTWLTDWLLYPVMYLQFASRKPIYQKYFGTVET